MSETKGGLNIIKLVDNQRFLTLLIVAGAVGLVVARRRQHGDGPVGHNGQTKELA